MAEPEGIKSVYSELCTPPVTADPGWFRARGYRFERLLADLLSVDKLEPRTGYRATGEQIDGSFFLDGKVFLLEAKWHQDEVPASTLYEFKGKVDGKLIGTIGVFVSMSGYSQDAVDALTLGKSLNLVLFDRRDMDAAINRELGFREVLKRKLRHAAEEGMVYFPIEADVVTKNDSSQLIIERLGFDHLTGRIFTQREPSSHPADLIVVCEGNLDRELIARIAQRLLSRTNSRKAIKIVVAMGKHNASKVANSMHSLDPGAKILVIVDGDGDPAKTREMLERDIEFSGWAVAIPTTEIESWAGLDRKSLQRLGTKRSQATLEAADRLDIDELRMRDQSFAAFYAAVTES